MLVVGPLSHSAGMLQGQIICKQSAVMGETMRPHRAPVLDGCPTHMLTWQVYNSVLDGCPRHAGLTRSWEALYAKSGFGSNKKLEAQSSNGLCMREISQVHETTASAA